MDIKHEFPKGCFNEGYYESIHPAEKCPVCNGRRFVPYGYYQDKLAQEWTNNDKIDLRKPDNTCRTCNGKGIVREK